MNGLLGYRRSGGSLVARLNFMDTEMRFRSVAPVLVALAVSTAYAQDTTINYKGQPPPTAMAPSLSAMGQDICAVPISGAVSSTVIGVAGGTVVSDKNCERIKLSKVLNDLGLKVAAVAVLCQDERVWDAMEMSGSPCPVGGAIGDTARDAWKKMTPDRFERLYGKAAATADAKPAGGW